MTRITSHLAILIASLLLSTPLLAGEVPYLGGRVNDYAGILHGPVVAELESLLKDYEARTTNQVVVLTVTTLEGMSIEEYSIKVAETWKLGQKGVDNGALLVVAKEERKVRIEVGYGLEASLTDAVTSMIIENEIVPRFKSGDYDAGVTAGVRAIIDAADGKLKVEEAQESIFATIGSIAVVVIVLGFMLAMGLFSESGCICWAFYVFFIMLFSVATLAQTGAWLVVMSIVLLLHLVGFPVMRRIAVKKKWLIKSTSRSGVHGGGGWFSGGGGGGFSGGFSGGGGSFGGGGSSGSW